MTITQRIAALTGGVSQRPQSQRGSGQADAQTNAHNHPLRGLLKRPPLEHFAQLTGGTTGLDQGFVHSIDLNDTDRFLAVVKSDGTIAVYDKTNGIAANVETVGTPDSYLTPLPETFVHEVELSGTDGTLLSAFTATTGYSFLKHGTEANTQFRTYNGGNLSWGNASVPVAEGYSYRFPVPVADYTVEATITFPAPRGPAANDQQAVYVRSSLTDKSGYMLRIDNAGSWNLERLDAAASRTAIASGAIGGWDPAVAHTLGLRAVGSNLSPIVDGVVISTHADATISAAGYAGIGGSGTGDNNGADGVATRAIMSYFSITYTTQDTTGPAPLRAAQVGKQTVIANSTVTVERGTESAPNKAFKALVSVRQADYGTQYSLKLDGIQILMGSPEGVTPQSRIQIDTTIIAAKLKDLIDGSNEFDAFTVELLGSTLVIYKTDGSDFTIQGDDGLADNGLLTIKGTVQSFSDLPEKAPHGFTVEVTGDPSNEFDNYFVKFDVTDAATNEGVWKECVKPGEPITLDASTMPHVLTYQGSFVPPTEHEGTPLTPTIVPGGGAPTTDGWDEAAAFNTRLLLDDHNDAVHSTLNGANGIQTEYIAYYDVDTRSMDGAAIANMVLYREDSVGAGTYTEVARKQYGPELLQLNQTISAVLTMAANQKLRLRLEYGSGATPTTKAKMHTAATTINFPNTYVTLRKTTDAAPVVFWKRTGKLVSFIDDQIYPQGITLRITCDGVNFDYTPVTDVTGVAVATQLKTQIDAHATFVATNPTPGDILVERADGTNTVVSWALPTWVAAKMYHDPDLSLVASALVGKRLKNLTDNSEGIVSANTSTTIFVTSLTGGFDNTFQKADKIEVLSTGRYFTFGPATWAEREAGDLVSNPMPSFVGQKINDVLITKGRLGFVSGGNIVLSGVGDLFNVFRTTVTQLLDGDVIDVKPAHGEAVRFHSYSSWDGRDIFWSSRHQFELSSDPILSPKTVKLLPISEYPMDAIRPVVLGRFAYFVTRREGYAQVWAMGVADGSQKPQAVRLTADVSQYLAGNALAIVGDEDMGVFFVLTDADRSKLYVHTYDRDSQHYAWSLWQFPAGTTIVGISILDGVLTVLSKQSDAAYLDTMDLEYTRTFDLLDRKKTFAAGTGVFAGGNTDWILPYSCATNGSEGTIVVLNASTGAIIASTRPTATTVRAVGNFSAVEVIIGISYTFSHTFSTIFRRAGQEQLPVIAGRLQLSRLRINYEDTRGFTVTVTPLGRPARSVSVDESADSDGTLVVPVQCQNKDVAIVITNSQPTQLRITDAEWEGNHFSRSRIG